MPADIGHLSICSTKKLHMLSSVTDTCYYDRKSVKHLLTGVHFKTRFSNQHQYQLATGIFL